MPSQPYSPPVDLPPPEPVKLLASWMEWEKGATAPGQVLANLKKGGLRELLEATITAQAELEGSPGEE
jgi:hypothetical protein